MSVTGRCLECNVTVMAPTMLEAVGQYAAHHSAQHDRPDPCPECKAGKCRNCDGTTWDFTKDEEGVCPCTH